MDVNLHSAKAERMTCDLGPKGDGRYNCVTCVSKLTVLRLRNYERGYNLSVELWVTWFLVFVVGLYIRCWVVDGALVLINEVHS